MGAWRRRIALMLLAAAMVVYFNRRDPEDLGKWMLLRAPIRLDVGEIRTPEFTARLDTPYWLFIEVDDRTEFDRLKPSLDAIYIDWQVLRDGHPVAVGSSRDSQGGFFGGGRMAREIGRFAPEVGKRYEAVLDIRHAERKLAEANPEFLVQTYPGEWKDALVGSRIDSTLWTIGAAALVLAGLLMMFLPGQPLNTAPGSAGPRPPRAAR